jgi:hypothetical protein
MPPLQTESGIIISPEKKVNALADTFSSAHINPLSDTYPNFTTQISNNVENFYNTTSNAGSIDYPIVEETKLYVRNLKTSKAPGYDKIHNSLVKNLPQCALVYLNFIIISCL